MRITAVAMDKTPAITTVAVVLKEELGRRRGGIERIGLLWEFQICEFGGGSYLQKLNKERLRSVCVFI